MVTIDTPEGIQVFAALQAYYALRIEVRCPGMRHSRGSIMKLIKSRYPQVQGNTKAAVLKNFGNLLIDAGILSEERR